MEPATAAGEVGFEHKVAERFETQNVLHEEAEGARGVGFPLARAPGVLLAESLREAFGDGGAGEEAFGGTERLAAGAGVNDLKASVDRVGERFDFSGGEDAG